MGKVDGGDSINKPGKGFRPRTRSVDRLSMGEGRNPLQAQGRAPVPKGYTPKWFILAIRITHEDGRIELVTCHGEHLYEDDPKMVERLATLRAYYPNAKVEAVN